MDRPLRIGFSGALYRVISKEVWLGLVIQYLSRNWGMSMDFSKCPILRCATWCSLLESSRSANVFRHGGEMTTGYRPALRSFREVLAESSHVLRRPRVEGSSAGTRSLESVSQIEGCRERLKISILPLRSIKEKQKGWESSSH